MKTGRNEPCWCGSGKKYKKCHLAQDESARRVSAVPTSVEPPIVERASLAEREPSSPPISPERAHWDEFWSVYAAAPLDDKIERARTCLATEAEVDGEMVFDLVEPLVRPLAEAGRFDALEELLREIEARHPDAAQENSGWFSMWRVESALLRGADPLPAALAWAPKAVELIDPFHWTLDRMMFHGHLQEAATVLAAAWPTLQESPDVVPWAIEQYRSIAIMLAAHLHLERSPEVLVIDEALRAAVAPYAHEEIRYDWIETFLRVDSGASPPLRAEEIATSTEALDWLVVSFARTLRERHGWPRARAEMARNEVLEFMIKHRDSILEHRREAPARKRSHTGARPEKRPTLEALLVPDLEAVDRALAATMSLFGARIYPGAALLAALPAWLEFLAAQGHVAEGVAQTSRASMQSLVPTAIGVYARMVYDPALEREINRCWATPP